jgi:SAM-dependent methyltransferase
MQSADPFPASEFDQWAEAYDADVLTDDTFPFAGYEQVLHAVVKLTGAEAGMSVLDLGVGTGNLALRFAALGCRVWCTDYSPSMLEKARLKLPEARLILHDLRDPFPPELNRRFDRIVSAYTFHHFDLDQKAALTSRHALEHVVPGGCVIIADISFASADKMRIRCRIGDHWNDEPYWLADEALPALRQTVERRIPASPVCGVLIGWLKIAQRTAVSFPSGATRYWRACGPGSAGATSSLRDGNLTSIPSQLAEAGRQAISDGFTLRPRRLPACERQSLKMLGSAADCTLMQHK